MKSRLLPLIAALLMLTATACAQHTIPAPIPHSITTWVAVDSLAKTDLVTGARMGFGGLKPSPWYHYYEIIRQQATTRELIEFTKHRNYVVRCYAFVALLDRDLFSVYPILNYYREDETVVIYNMGCLNHSFRFRDFLIIAALHFNKLTPKEAEYVRRLLPKDFNPHMIPLGLF